MLIGVGVSCRFSNSIASYLYVSCSGLITSVGEERAYFSVVVYLQLCGFYRPYLESAIFEMRMISISILVLFERK